MYASCRYDVCMPKRTTIEIDEALLARARRTLGAPTMRATVEEALRRVAAQGEDEAVNRGLRQAAYLRQLSDHADLAVLGADDMWR